MAPGLRGRRTVLAAELTAFRLRQGRHRRNRGRRSGGSAGTTTWCSPSPWRAGTPTSTRPASRCRRRRQSSRGTHRSVVRPRAADRRPTVPAGGVPDMTGPDPLRRGPGPRAGRRSRPASAVLERTGGRHATAPRTADLRPAAPATVPAGHVLPGRRRGGRGVLQTPPCHRVAAGRPHRRRRGRAGVVCGRAPRPGRLVTSARSFSRPAGR